MITSRHQHTPQLNYALPPTPHHTTQSFPPLPLSHGPSTNSIDTSAHTFILPAPTSSDSINIYSCGPIHPHQEQPQTNTESLTCTTNRFVRSSVLCTPLHSSRVIINSREALIAKNNNPSTFTEHPPPPLTTRAGADTHPHEHEASEPEPHHNPSLC